MQFYFRNHYIFLHLCLLPVPNYTIKESEIEATKEGHSLSDFKYACVGYSVFLSNKDSSMEKGEKQAELPFCAGLEVIIRRTYLLFIYLSCFIAKFKL